jgi:hypothetical protein
MTKTLVPPSKENSPEMETSSQWKSPPRLSHRGLTLLLIGMCVIPILTIGAIWQFLPKVEEGKLQANITASGLPGADYYAVDYRERPPFDGGEIVIQNLEDQDWTHLNIQVNRHYQVYDTQPIEAGSERAFKLDRFISRTGARFSLRYNELQSVRVYARRPTKDRATYFKEFETTQ